MATAQQIINEALKYEGEGGSRFQNAAGMPGQPWCAMFVWYVFKQVGASSLYCGGQGICSVEGIYSYFTGQSLFSQDPKPGDLVLYDWANTTGRFNHVGIVISADANYIYTIEGNTTGSLVARRQRARNSEIIGYCHPKYSGTTGGNTGGGTTGGGTTTTHPTLSSGSTGSEVKLMQQKLMMLGYNCGTSGADGDFGSGTLTAVKNFQSANGLTVDGIVGANTHAKLDAKYNALNVFTATCNLEGLKVRTGDSTSYAIFSAYPSLKKGEKVKVARVTSNNWYFALVGERYVAYMAAKYMKKG